MPNTFSMQWAPPEVLDFANYLQEHLDSKGKHSLFELKDTFTQFFSDQKILSKIYNNFLRHVIATGAVDGDAAIGPDVLMIRYSQNMVLRIIKNRSDVTSFSAKAVENVLFNYPSDSFIIFMSREPVLVDWYSLDKEASFDRLDSSLKIRLESTQLCEPGSCIYVDSARRFPSFKNKEGTIYIVLSSGTVNSQIVSFDEYSLSPLGASMSSDVNSIICVMLDLVKRSDEKSELESIKSLLSHEDHHVRWAATTTLGKLDRNAAMNAVKDMAVNDSHKFIRDAANKTLQLVEGNS
jgi:hypothetical protein